MPSAPPSLEEVLISGIWAEEAKLLQSTHFIAKYFPVRRVLVVRAES